MQKHRTQAIIVNDDIQLRIQYKPDSLAAISMQELGLIELLMPELIKLWQASDDAKTDQHSEDTLISYALITVRS